MTGPRKTAIGTAWGGLATALFLSGCGVEAYELKKPLRPTTDLTRFTVAKALCSRGENPFIVFVNADGTARGRIVETKEEFPLALVPVDESTVRLDLERGAASQDTLAEPMKPVISGGQTILRGDTVDCTEVEVRRDP